MASKPATPTTESPPKGSGPALNPKTVVTAASAATPQPGKSPQAVVTAGAGANVNANADPTKPATVQAIKPPPFRIVPLTAANRWLKLLVYAAYGVGKTTLAGSSVDVPEMRDVFMINCEGGELSVEDSPDIQNADLIDQVRTTDIMTIGAIHDYLKSHCIARDNNDIRALKFNQARFMSTPDNIVQPHEITEDEGEEGPYRLRRYRTVLFDSVTEADVYSMNSILKVKGDLDVSADIEVADWPKFRQNNQRMQMVLRAFRDLPMHVIFCCSAAWTQDDQKKLLWKPRLTGQLADQAQGFVDVVGYLRTEKPVKNDAGVQVIPRTLLVQPAGNFDAKNRIASFTGLGFRNPTMAKLMKVLHKPAKTFKPKSITIDAGAEAEVEVVEEINTEPTPSELAQVQKDSAEAEEAKAMAAESAVANADEPVLAE
jgi:hypothetical protein